MRDNYTAITKLAIQCFSEKIDLSSIENELFRYRNQRLEVNCNSKNQRVGLRAVSYIPALPNGFMLTNTYCHIPGAIFEIYWDIQNIKEFQVASSVNKLKNLMRDFPITAYLEIDCTGDSKAMPAVQSNLKRKLNPEWNGDCSEPVFRIDRAKCTVFEDSAPCFNV